MSAALGSGVLAALAVLVLGQSGGAARVRRWARSAHPRGRHPGADAIPGPLVLDLVAAVLAAGAPVTTALDLVAEALREYAPAQAEHLADLARRQALALPRPSSAGPAWLGVLERTLLLAGDAGGATVHSRRLGVPSSTGGGRGAVRAGQAAAESVRTRPHRGGPVRQLVRSHRCVRRRAEAGMATAEYAVVTLAACGFAGLLVAILRSDAVRGLLLGIIQRALAG